MLTILRAGVSTNEIARSFGNLESTLGLADTNGEIFADSNEGEEIRFHVPGTDTREKG